MNSCAAGTMDRRFRLVRTIVSPTMLILAVVLLGCEDDTARVLTESPPPIAAAESEWRVDEMDGERIARLAVDREELRQQLAEAAEQARASADEARERWRETAESQRRHWAVKWAAPVVDDDEAVEHVWVRPLHWSPFRIEGVLLSEPDRPLDAPGGPPDRGEIVSFPAEALSDWVRWHSDEPNAARDGGYTIDVLERAAGPVR